MSALFNILGNIGVAGVLIAYFLLQKGKLAPDSYVYLGINFGGAVVITLSLCWNWNLPAFMMEASWAVVSLYGVAKRWQKDHSSV